MPKARSPRKGSMQFWPRKRALKETARVGTWTTKKTNSSIPSIGILGFAGYKVGMTHIHYIDNNKNSPKKGMEVFQPVTIIECPSLHIVSIRFYKNSIKGLQASKDIFVSSFKDLKKRITLPKNKIENPLNNISLEGIQDIRILMSTEPKITGMSKKVPDLFEVALSGSVEEKFNFIKENYNKPISVEDVFSSGAQVDIHAVTTGKGFQGPVKRFGVAIRESKSEKTKRGPGSLGPWKGQQHIQYRVAHAGQMGYHLRTEYNKQIFLIGKNPNEINAIGGFVRYGLVKSTYILIAGSTLGPVKRLIRFNYSLNPDRKKSNKIPEITNISLESKQR